MSETELRASSIFDRCLGAPWLGTHARVWRRLPPRVAATRLGRAYGAFLHRVVTRSSDRQQRHGTFFLRNRPELALVRQLLDGRPRGSCLRLSVLACSNGAEVYSFIWAIRSARPDLRLKVHAIDISAEVVQIAQEGRYSRDVERLIEERIFDRLSAEEVEAMFDRQGQEFQIKPWLRDGIDWCVGDATDPALVQRLGPQDIVVANRFLCHMPRAAAAACLRRIGRLVAPGGHLFVSGVDLDVRTQVATELDWKPVRELLEEIHDGDPSVRKDWPLRYWGLEPLDERQRDWLTRYASVFQIGTPIAVRQ